MRISDWGSDVCSSDLPFLFAERREAGAKKTLFSYGHGDVIRGQDAQWRSGISPWALVQEGEKLFGRGTADNKGQHTVNIAALAAVLKARGGKLGFNVVLLIETGEEVGSPGLDASRSEEHTSELQSLMRISYA